jgi:hypothetical protein
MNSRYNSGLAPYIIGMIEQKQSLGYPYVVSSGVLGDLDRFCQVRYPDEHTLTKDICDEWASAKDGEKPRSLQTRVAPVRELARYMGRAGIFAYVIPSGSLPRGTERRTPHILTDEELRLFFAATDGINARS